MIECPGTPVVFMRFGSHLYGTATPASDTDYKGVFLPSAADVLLGRIPKSALKSTGNDTSKNTAADVDVEWYSLHYFLKLACEGQTVALDMLHAPDDWPEVSSDAWRELRARRAWFHTRNLKAFVGYCRKQAAKYGVKGSRLAAVKSAIAAIEGMSEETRLEAIWDSLPSGDEFCQKSGDGQGRSFWIVCGRSLQSTISVEQALGSLRKFASNYGERARQAEDNAGIDWKAVSHAFRAAYEVLAILRTGDVTFPLAQADFLRDVKLGKLDYRTEAGPALEAVMDECEREAASSTLPDEVNAHAVGSWLIGTMSDHMRRTMP